MAYVIDSRQLKCHALVPLVPLTKTAYKLTGRPFIGAWGRRTLQQIAMYTYQHHATYVI